MRRILSFIFLLTLISAPAIVGAQQAGDNINVLPLVPNVDSSDPGYDPDWFLKGDGYLQRQLEPTIAASTRNPDHLLAFFNDYRAVDVGDDIGLGEGEIGSAALKTLNLMLASVPWLQIPDLGITMIRPQPMAASEAWVGMSRSYDGGLTWSGGFLPGAPFDGSPASLDSPVYGLEAATDPVTVCGPCGQFYTVFVAFTRGGQSKLAVARYEDLNNDPGGDTLVYKGTTVVDSGANANFGHFLDKPHIAIDVWRNESSKAGIEKKKKPKPSEDNDDPCAHRVYVSYSTFTGKPKPNKFQSKLYVATSEDGGETFNRTKINKNFGQNQGSALAVDPREGTPTTTGGGTLYAFWRHFNGPDSIVMTKSLDFGGSWSRPEQIIGSTPMAPFDQPTISTQAVYDFGLFDPITGLPEVAFRSNGFPTATVATDPQGDATVFVGWQERVGGDGYPLENGTPRIVLMRSDDDGDSWTDIEGNPGQRKAVDIGWRDLESDPSAPEPGFGTVPLERPSGPQIQPALSFAGGRLMMVYSESRGRIANYGNPDLEEILTSQFNPDADIDSQTGFISGYDRLMDHRAALLDPATGELLSTVQVSRYPLRAGSDLADGEDYEDVAPINPPCSPDYDAYFNAGELNPCVRQLNRVNAVTSAAGTSPFVGDYPGIHPFVQFVTDSEGNWRWATDPDDLTTRGFHTIWADNRHLIPPQNPSPGSPWVEWQDYPNYDAPGSGDLSCANPGSRNTDVLTSRVDAELVINSPTTFKAIGATGASFPFSIGNKTGETRTYQISIEPDDGNASFLSRSVVTTASVEIFPFSSTSQVVYVSGPTTDPIKVTVQETGGCGSDCQSGTIVFNAHQSMASEQLASEEFFNPTVTPDAFVINQNLENAFVINQGAENAFVINPTVDNAFVINGGTENAFVINAFVINAFVINAFVINSGLPAKAGEEPEYYDIHNIIDTTWTVTPGESTDASSFLPIINIDKAEQFLDKYVFQLIVHKGALYGSPSLEGCDSTNVNQPQILSTFAQGPGTNPADAFVINPAPKNAFVINQGFPGDAFVINSTFTVAPSDDGPDNSKNGSLSNDGTLKAPRAPDTVNVTLRAYQIVPDEELGEFRYNPFPADDPNNPNPGTAGDRASFAASSHNCDTLDPLSECFEFNAPDLVPIDVDPTEILPTLVGESFDFPSWTLLNQGTTDGNAENDDLRHGFYLCPRWVVADAPEDLTLDLSPCTQFIDEGEILFTTDNSLPPAGEDDFDATTLNIPEGTLPGLYDVVLYVDDLFQVSEFIEVNNYASVPIIVIDELLENGGFETPDVAAGAWALFENGTDGLDWSFEWVNCGGCETDPTARDSEQRRGDHHTGRRSGRRTRLRLRRCGTGQPDESAPVPRFRHLRGSHLHIRLFVGKNAPARI